MRKLIRRWFGASDPGDGAAAAAAWADASGHRFARSRDGSGFVIEPARAQAGWRMEWGAPQRRYIEGAELRLRAEVGIATDLQMLVATRSLMTQLEQQVFEAFTEGTQTRIDDSTPEEMRWLVLYAKLPRAEMPALRERFGALANLPPAAPMWLEGPLTQQLVASSSWLADDQPLVLVLHRARLTLRCQLAHPDVSALQGALGLFGVALAAARRVCEEVVRGGVGSERPSTWGPPSAMPPADEAPR